MLNERYAPSFGSNNESDASDDGLQSLPEHPIIQNEAGRSIAPVASSLSSSLSSEATPIALPPAPTLDRLQHLRTHLKQLKRLYRQEVHQEELACRDSLLQTVCTSSVTLFRHCASTERFFTAVRALLTQYLPAAAVKVFEVNKCDGQTFLVSPKKDGKGVDAVKLSTEPFEWETLGVAGRAVASVHALSTQQLASTSNSVGPKNETLGCATTWLEKAAGFGSPNTKDKLVLRIPTSELVSIGFRPEIDLTPALRSSERDISGTKRNHSQALLLVVLRDSNGYAVGAFEALVAESQNLNSEVIDVMSILLVAALHTRRAVCRSPMSNLNVEINRQQTDSSCLSLSVPIPSNTIDEWRITAGGDGAVLNEVDSVMLSAIGKPVALLLDEMEDQSIEISAVAYWSQQLEHLWSSMVMSFSAENIQEARCHLRKSIADFVLTRTIRGVHSSSNHVSLIDRVRILCQGEDYNQFQAAYEEEESGVGKVERDYAALEHVVRIRLPVDSTREIAFAITTEGFPINGMEATTEASTVVAVLIGIKSQEGGDKVHKSLVRAVTNYLLPLLQFGVKYSAQVVASFKQRHQLGCELKEALSTQFDQQQVLAVSRVVDDVTKLSVASTSTEEIMKRIHAANYPNVVVGMTLFAVDADKDNNESSVWTIDQGVRVPIARGLHGVLLTPDNVVQLVQARNRARHGTDSSSTDYAPTQFVTKPLLDPTNDHVIGVIEFEFESTLKEATIQPAAGLLACILGGVIKKHKVISDIQSKCIEELNDQSSTHREFWKTWVRFLSKWSQLSLDSISSPTSWAKAIEHICCDLLPSIDFVNVFLCFETEICESILNSKLVAYARESSGRDTPINVDSGIRRELSLHNQCVLGNITPYCLMSRKNDLLGVVFASKTANEPLSENECQLMQMAIELIKNHVVELQARLDSQKRVNTLQMSLADHSTKLQDLSDANINLSKRERQLLVLCELAKVDYDYVIDLMDACQDKSDMPHIMKSLLQKVVERLSDVLESSKANEICTALVIEHLEGRNRAQLIYSDSADIEFEVSNEDNDWINKHASTARTLQFLSFPSRVRQCLSSSFQSQQGNCLELMYIVPVESADKSCGALLMLASAEDNLAGVMDSLFMKELGEAMNRHAHQMRCVNGLVTNTTGLNKTVQATTQRLQSVYQDYRLLELANIVWIEVMACSSQASGVNNLAESTKQLYNCLEDSFNRRIVSFLREDLDIVSTALVIENPLKEGAPTTCNVDDFILKLDPARASAIRVSSSSTVFETDTASNRPHLRLWLMQRLLHKRTSESIGAFYIEWEEGLTEGSVDKEETIKPTLLWVGDWLQVLVQYCHDWSNINVQAATKAAEVAQLSIQEEAHTENINRLHMQENYWQAMVEYAKGFYIPEANASDIPSDEEQMREDSSGWNAIFSNFSGPMLENIGLTIWAREILEDKAVAWTFRTGTTIRESLCWSDLMQKRSYHPELFNEIIMPSTGEPCGVIERTSESSRTLARMLAIVLGSFLHKRQLQDYSRRLQRQVQIIQDGTLLQNQKWQHLIKQTQTLHEIAEAEVQQLILSPQPNFELNSRGRIQKLLNRLEKQIEDAVRLCIGNCSLRFLLRYNDEVDCPLICACDQDCVCQSSSVNASTRLKLEQLIHSGDKDNFATVINIPPTADFAVRSLFFPPCRSDNGVKIDRFTAIDVENGISMNEETTKPANLRLTLLWSTSNTPDDDNTNHLILAMKIISTRLVNAVAELVRRDAILCQREQLKNTMEEVKNELENERARAKQMTESAQLTARNIASLLQKGGSLGDCTDGALNSQGKVDRRGGTPAIAEQQRTCSPTSRRENDSKETIITSRPPAIEIEENGAITGCAISSPPSNLYEDPQPTIDDAAATLIDLTYTVRAIQSYKSELEDDQSQVIAENARLQEKIEQIELNCLELKSTLQKSETQYALLKAKVKNGLEPIAMYALTLMSKWIGKDSNSHDADLEMLRKTLSKIDGACSVHIRPASQLQQSFGAATPAGICTGKQTLISERQLQQISDRCIARQETDVLSLRPSKAAPEVKRWVIISPCVVHDTKLACVVIIEDHPLGLASSRRELFQASHVRLLCQIASWRSEHLRSERILQDQFDHLHVQHEEMIQMLHCTKRQLELLHRGEENRKRMLDNVVKDSFRVLGWDEKAWSKMLSSKRKRVAAWNQLTRMFAERISVCLRSHARVHLYGVIGTQGFVFHLPRHVDPTRKGFDVVAFTNLAQSPSTRHIWDAITSSENQSRLINGTVVVPVFCSDDSQSAKNCPIAIVEVTIDPSDATENQAEIASTTRELIEALAPFIEGIVHADCLKRGGVLGEHHHGQQGEISGLRQPRMESDGVVRTKSSYDIHFREPWGRDEVTENSNSSPIHGAVQNIANRNQSDWTSVRTHHDDGGDDSASCSTDFSETRHELEKQCAISERVISFLIDLKKTTNWKSLQRLVTDRMKVVWQIPQRQTGITFELVEFPDMTSNQREDSTDPVQSELLPHDLIDQVVFQIKRIDGIETTAIPPLFKFESVDKNDYWITVISSKSISSNQKDSPTKSREIIALLIARLPRCDLPLFAQFPTRYQQISVGVEHQIQQIRRILTLQGRLASFEKAQTGSTELVKKLDGVEHQCRNLNSFTKLALQVSVAQSEREVIRKTTKYLREMFGCRVVFEQQVGDRATSDTQRQNNDDENHEAVLEILHRLVDKESDESDVDGDDYSNDVVSTRPATVAFQHTIKLRVSSSVIAAASALRGTFSVYLEPGVTIPHEYHKKQLRSVLSVVTAAFDRLQANGLVHQLQKEVKQAGQRHVELSTEKDRLHAAFKQQAVVVSDLQNQFDSLVHINSEMEAEIAVLRSRLYESEERRAHTEAEVAATHDKLQAATTCRANVDESTLTRLQEEVVRLQGRERVLEKRNVKRRLQMQQLVDEINRLKKTEEIDRVRILELEKQLAMSNGRQQPLNDHARINKNEFAAELSGTKQHFVAMNTTEKRVDLQMQHERQVQRMKQLRLAEELRCLAALEVREISTRQHDQPRLTSRPAKVRPYGIPRPVNET